MQNRNLQYVYFTDPVEKFNPRQFHLMGVKNIEKEVKFSTISYLKGGLKIK